EAAEPEADHRVHLGLIVADRRALRRDDEVMVRAEVIVEAADVRHDEPIRVAQRRPDRSEQTEGEAVIDRLALELDLDFVVELSRHRSELARVAGPKPAAVHVGGVRTIEEVLEAMLNR